MAPTPKKRPFLLPILIALFAYLAYRFFVPCHGGLPPDAFRGSRVLLTGASSGIGVELAKQLADAGAKVVIAARRAKELNETARLAGDSVYAVPTDTGNTTASRMLVARAVEIMGGLDVLLLNHAVSNEFLASELDANEFDYQISLHMHANLAGSAALAHAALPHLERSPRKNGGQIIVVSSASAKTPAPFHSAYVASKRSLHGFFDTLRHELHLLRSRTSISILVLGLIKTPYIAQDEGLAALALSVPTCASEMLCDIHRRVEESYIPRWMGIVTPLLMVNSWVTERVSDLNYVGKVGRFAEVIREAADRVRGWRENDV